MFIYACAHSLAEKKSCNYCLSDLSSLKYFSLKKNEILFNKIKFLWFRVSSKFLKYKFHHFQDNRIDYSLNLITESSRRNWYYGYFQGENYFYNNKSEIKKRFLIKSKYHDSFKKLKNKIIGQSKYAIIHIRLKDFKTFGPDFLNGPDLSLPFKYYHEQIKKIPKDFKIIFLSDEIDLIKKEFSYIKNAHFSENSIINDLQFIINADICILSCSTFSWWGAWLNKNNKKIVYVPDHFLGFKVNKEFPVNIIPEEWIKVPVNL
tara:strand:+ start:3521 stop:4306 length:786 start_codon:yes stop_codon:yes gene_type:complete